MPTKQSTTQAAIHATHPPTDPPTSAPVCHRPSTQAAAIHQFNPTIYYICSDNKAHEFVASLCHPQLPPHTASPHLPLPLSPSLGPAMHVADCPCTAICAQQQQQQLLQQTATVERRVISFTQTQTQLVPPLHPSSSCSSSYSCTVLLIRRKPALTATVPN